MDVPLSGVPGRPSRRPSRHGPDDTETGGSRAGRGTHRVPHRFPTAGARGGRRILRLHVPRPSDARAADSGPHVLPPLREHPKGPPVRPAPRGPFDRLTPAPGVEVLAPAPVRWPHGSTSPGTGLYLGGRCPLT